MKLTRKKALGVFSLVSVLATFLVSLLSPNRLVAELLGSSKVAPGDSQNSLGSVTEIGNAIVNDMTGDIYFPVSEDPDSRVTGP